MLNSVVDAFHSFASSVELADGLRIARREFVTLRGDLSIQIAITKHGWAFSSTGFYVTGRFG